MHGFFEKSGGRSAGRIAMTWRAVYRNNELELSRYSNENFWSWTLHVQLFGFRFKAELGRDK